MKSLAVLLAILAVAMKPAGFVLSFLLVRFFFGGGGGRGLSLRHLS